MTVLVQNNAVGAGAGNLDAPQAAVDLAVIANGDTGFGLAAQVGNRQQVTYAQTLPGNPPNRLNALVNTVFTPNYGAGAQTVNVVILPVLANFVLNDGTSILVVGGTALAPQNSGLAGAGLNTTNDCLVIYDTTQNNGSGYCTARGGTGGTLDLPTPNPVILYHELSHALRVVNNTQLALTAACNPSSPEENAAIVDENDLRNQIATAAGTAATLRDPGIHCGDIGCAPNCCIIASVASGSPLSDDVASLRTVRDSLLRRTEVGYAFFGSLHYDYYGFSPQVCTLLAADPRIRPLVLEGFVRPLVRILGLIQAFALEGAGPQDLGERFAQARAGGRPDDEWLATLRKAQGLLAGHDVELTSQERSLADIASPALASEHLVWSLVEPIRIHQFGVESIAAQHSIADVGCTLYAAIDSWTARMPIDDVWTSLSTVEVREELAMLDATLLRTPVARTIFRDRLMQRFGALPAIARALREERSP